MKLTSLLPKSKARSPEFKVWVQKYESNVSNPNFRTEAVTIITRIPYHLALKPYPLFMYSMNNEFKHQKIHYLGQMSSKIKCSNEQFFQAMQFKTSWRESSDSNLISPRKPSNIWILMWIWNRSFCVLTILLVLSRLILVLEPILLILSRLILVLFSEHDQDVTSKMYIKLNVLCFCVLRHFENRAIQAELIYSIAFSN